MNKLICFDISKHVVNLPLKGKLIKAHSNLIYLDVDDNYIHNVFPAIKEKNIKKPNYFTKQTSHIGAHISVAYPEETRDQSSFTNELGREYTFTIGKLFSTIIGNKKYYALEVTSNPLLELRIKYGLTKKLCFKKCLIDFHITVGVQILSESHIAIIGENQK